MKKIIVPVDGSEYSKQTIAAARMMAKAFGSCITIITVAEIEALPQIGWVQMEAYDIHDYKALSQKLLDEAKSELSDLGDKVTAVMLEGEPSHEIIEYVESSDADLVIMGSHGRGFGRFLLGSVSSKVIHHTNTSVMIVRNKEVQ